MINKAFPYIPRHGQEQMLKDIEHALHTQTHIVLEAPTGSGKTITVLVPVLEFALKHHKRVLYLTRTNSQQIQVLKEVRKIRKILNLRAFPVQGRNNYCLLAIEGQFKGGSADEIQLLCDNLKKEVLKHQKKEACIYYYNFLKHNGAELITFQNLQLATAEKLVEQGKILQICPYETMKIAIQTAELVVAPYPYYFDPYIRERLMEWMQCTAQDLIVIVDEAHNLPSFARDLQSATLSAKTLDYVDSEIKEYGEFTFKNLRSSELSELVREAMFILKEELLKAHKDEALLAGAEFEDTLHGLLKLDSYSLRQYLKELQKYGEKIKHYKLENKKLPRSYIYNTARFLNTWLDIESETLIKLITNDSVLKLELYSLDPTTITSAVEDAYVSIHMSGTLRPLEEYVANVFVNKHPIMKVYASPFPAENLKITYVSDITTKYEIMEKDNNELYKIIKYIEEIVNTSNKNCVVFFPSYRVLEKVLALGLNLNTNTYIDQRSLSQKNFVQMVNSFKRYGGTFITVMSSRFSEGLNFPEGELEMVIIVGVPYPKPTVKQKALEHYYSIKFGQKYGYLYTVKAPTTRRMLQAIGRLIRSEHDRGFAIILDKRASYFKESIPAQHVDNIIEEIKTFFSS